MSYTKERNYIIPDKVYIVTFRHHELQDATDRVEILGCDNPEIKRGFWNKSTAQSWVEEQVDLYIRRNGIGIEEDHRSAAWYRLRWEIKEVSIIK